MIRTSFDADWQPRPKANSFIGEVWSDGVRRVRIASRCLRIG
ncbi:hypothetical protein [Streptomyces mirabilis]